MFHSPLCSCTFIVISGLLFKNNQHDVTCGLSFIFMGSRHSLSTCFKLSGSSKHVESEWRLPMKIKDSPQVTSCCLFLNNYNDARNNGCKIGTFVHCCLCWCCVYICCWSCFSPVCANQFVIFLEVQFSAVMCVVIFTDCQGLSPIYSLPEIWLA